MNKPLIGKWNTEKGPEDNFRGYYSVLVDGRELVTMRDFAGALSMMLHLWISRGGESPVSIEYTDDVLHYVVTAQPARILPKE